jgi:hypothetical protein
VPKFIKNWALLVAVGGVAVFCVSALFFTTDQLSDATAIVMIIACTAGLWRWAPTGWRVFWKGARRPEDWGILACAWFWSAFWPEGFTASCSDSWIGPNG